MAWSKSFWQIADNPVEIIPMYGHYICNALNGADNKNENRLMFVARFSCTYAITNCSVYLSVGTYARFGLGMEWLDNAPFRRTVSRSSLNYPTLQPVAVRKPHPTLSIGAGPTVTPDKVDLYCEGLPVNAGEVFRFNRDDFNAEFNVGLMWKPTERHAFGLAYRGASENGFPWKNLSRGPAPIPSRVENANVERDFREQVVVGAHSGPIPSGISNSTPIGRSPGTEPGYRQSRSVHNPPLEF